MLATAGDALQAACNVLNAHLESRTYLASERLTVADISLAEALAALGPFNITSLASFPYLLRYFNTVQATAKPKAPSVGVAVPGSKWGRGRIRIKELLQQGTALVGQEVVAYIVLCLYVILYRCWLRVGFAPQEMQIRSACSLWSSPMDPLLKASNSYSKVHHCCCCLY